MYKWFDPDPVFYQYLLHSYEELLDWKYIIKVCTKKRNFWTYSRTEDCTIETIGKPVFKKYSPDQYGGWMMDPAPRDPEDYLKESEPAFLIKTIYHSTWIIW